MKKITIDNIETNDTFYVVKGDKINTYRYFAPYPYRNEINMGKSFVLILNDTEFVEVQRRELITMLSSCHTEYGPAHIEKHRNIKNTLINKLRDSGNEIEDINTLLDKNRLNVDVGDTIKFDNIEGVVQEDSPFKYIIEYSNGLDHRIYLTSFEMDRITLIKKVKENG